MSDTELTATAATVVMRWEVIGYDERWSPLVAIKQDDGHITQHWEPLKDWNNTMQLSEKVGEMDIELISDGCRVHIWPNETTVSVFDKSPQRAITIAAILASQSQ